MSYITGHVVNTVSLTYQLGLSRPLYTGKTNFIRKRLTSLSILQDKLLDCTLLTYWWHWLSSQSPTGMPSAKLQCLKAETVLRVPNRVCFILWNRKIGSPSRSHVDWTDCNTSAPFCTWETKWNEPSESRHYKTGQDTSGKASIICKRTSMGRVHEQRCCPHKLQYYQCGHWWCNSRKRILITTAWRTLPHGERQNWASHCMHILEE